MTAGGKAAFEHLEIDLARAKARGEAVCAAQLLRQVAEAGKAQHVRAGGERERRHSRRLLGGEPPVRASHKLAAQMLHACTATFFM